jgi:hypothetical protein
MQQVTISRYDWLKAVGTVGGVERAATAIILMLLSYFTRIDYLAEFVKELFLEK